MWDQRPQLKAQLLSWLPEGNWKFTEIRDWFHEVYREPKGRYIWALPPAIADVALENLCEAKHIFPISSQVFVCPNLFTGRWRKTLGKMSDVTAEKRGSTDMIDSK